METVSELTHPVRPISRRGFSLGARLAFSTALIITLIMGATSVGQQMIVVQDQQRLRQDLLRASLAPRAVRLEQATTLNAMRHSLQEFHEAYRTKGFPVHDVVLKDSSGGLVLSTVDAAFAEESAGHLQAEAPISSPLIDGGRGTLVVLKDIQEYKDAVRRGWLLWVAHFAITISVVSLFLAAAIYRQVTKPVNRLLQGVKKMEMGYWGTVDVDGGAWEIRWLAWRFGSMVQEVRSSITQLFEAERKARLRMNTRPGTAVLEAVRNSSNRKIGSAEPSDSPVIDELIAVCQKIELGTPNDPEVLRLARNVWRQEAVIANRYGLHQVKARLEDAALRVIEPETYADLDERVRVLKSLWRGWAVRHRDIIREELDKESIPCAAVLHRVKHTAGVWSKMRGKGLEFDEVYDLFAFRIIVPTEADCYAALGVIHQLFKPEVSRFKDYISEPKANGYRCLHTCVRAADGPTFEIQIRSIAMDQQAEQGDAAHWLYKNSGREERRETDASFWWRRLLENVYR